MGLRAQGLPVLLPALPTVLPVHNLLVPIHMGLRAQALPVTTCTTYGITCTYTYYYLFTPKPQVAKDVCFVMSLSRLPHYNGVWMECNQTINSKHDHSLFEPHVTSDSRQKLFAREPILCIEASSYGVSRRGSLQNTDACTQRARNVCLIRTNK